MEGGLGVVASKRPCFIEDDGLASLAVEDMEAGFSGSCQTGHKRPTTQGLYSRPLYYARRSSSLRNLSCLVPSSSSNSPRSTRFYDASRFEDHHQPHFLEACFGCKKVLGDNKDIFMYRGDTPFCSEECRQEQIEIDEAKERNWNLSTMQALRKKEQKKSSSSSPSKPQDYPSRTGTIAAA